MIGLDTGFFVEVLRNNPLTVEVWKQIMEGEAAVVSCLTLYEIKRLANKGAIESVAAATLMEAIVGMTKVIWIGNREILEAAAGLSHGLGIPSIDALILAGFVAHKTDVIYSTDAHFQNYRKKGVVIEIIH